METRIAARLRDQLGTAKSANEMFRIFSRYNALFVRSHIRGAIREYQTQLIQRVKDDIESLHNKFKVSALAGAGERECVFLIYISVQFSDAVQQDHYSSDVHQIGLPSCVQCHHLGQTGVREYIILYVHVYMYLASNAHMYMYIYMMCDVYTITHSQSYTHTRSLSRSLSLSPPHLPLPYTCVLPD